MAVGMSSPRGRCFIIEYGHGTWGRPAAPGLSSPPLPSGASTGGRWPGDHRRRGPARGSACSLPGPAGLGGPGRSARAAGRAHRRGPGPDRPAENLAADRHRGRWLRIVTGAVIAFLTVANLLAAVRLVVEILTNNKLFAAHPGGLLAAGGVVWATNVIAFGLWYWDLDRGGAASRAHHPDRNPAFVFPEMQHSRIRARQLGAPVRRLPLAGLLDRHRDQPDRHISDQAVGQAAHDARSGLLDRAGRARHRPRHQRSLEA